MTRRYNAGDIDGVIALFAPDGVIRSGGTFRGPAELREHFDQLEGLFRDARLNIEELHEAGDTVIIEVNHEATAPDGNPVSLPMTMVFEFEGDRIAEQRGYVDPGTFATILRATEAVERGEPTRA